jgi:hypothetical protein
MQARQKPMPSLQFGLGDMVLIDGDLGQVIGVCYGQIAYDVIVRDLVFRNVAPERVRLALLSSHERVAFQTKAETQITNFLDRLRIARARRVTH